MSTSTAIFGTLTGCIGCVVDIESISKRSPGCMNLMTFATFVWISFVGLVVQSNYFTKLPSNKIPILRGYLPIVALFFIVSVSNNLSLNFDIPMPLFIIFRSGTLLANLLLGRLLLSRVYSWRKILAVVLVTVGIILFTMASSKEKSEQKAETRSAIVPDWISMLRISPFIIGVSLLTSALFISAYLGIQQEILYRTYGKHPEEAMFFIPLVWVERVRCFQHVLSLPGFLFLSNDIWETSQRFSRSPAFSVFGVNVWTSLWVQLISICVLQ
ncbi:unnamed protein product [Anisakis simplex]|uniref:UDP-xylose and UDP-N-acetylglucosamine transporter (inferred by orthology to a human protein) n=1 Tax=Anisakis simplex TaxID=6269 RepID=A0A0M3K1S7_ANISI|nr:unnamed protein product [Anisakis simplex]